ncbi:MAG: CCA-adding enzyme [Firmicutes bacterium ADurb.Bin146]|nr:MAG: CCA-adding enzyme [Firmicutes bacterium ADurb.Bin146]
MANKLRRYIRLKKYKSQEAFYRYFEDHISIIDKIRDNGYKAYFIGGCVRDALMGRNPTDFDIATNAKPEEIKMLFDYVKETGIAFGTVTVFFNNISYEITTFRNEYGYTDYRKPDLIIFSNSLYDDIRRRDFTINSLAYDGLWIYDYFEAYEHIKKKIIKTVGSAKRRFREDALRILRAARFACVLGFEIDSNTLANMSKYSYLIKEISKERIYSELYKIIEKADDLSILVETGIADQIFIYPHQINTKSIKGITFECRFTYLFSNYPDQQMVIEELKNLKVDKRTSGVVLEVLKYSDVDTDEKSIRKLLTLIKKNSISVLLEYKGQSQKVFDDVITKGYISEINDLDISGHDIMALGYPQNSIKEIKKMLFEKVIYDISLNKKKTLIDIIKTQIII